MSAVTTLANSTAIQNPGDQGDQKRPAVVDKFPDDQECTQREEKAGKGDGHLERDYTFREQGDRRHEHRFHAQAVLAVENALALNQAPGIPDVRDIVADDMHPFVAREKI